VLFYNMPTFLLVLAGLIPVEPVPADPAVRNAKMAAVVPRLTKVSVSSSTSIVSGHEKGTAPRLPSGCVVSFVSQSIVNHCFGHRTAAQNREPLRGADTLPFCDISRAECLPLLHEQLSGASTLPWPAFRQILAWYGGGPFVGIPLVVDANSVAASYLAAPVTFELRVPSPSGLSFSFRTRNATYTVCEVIMGCLVDGDSLFDDGASHKRLPGDQNDLQLIINVCCCINKLIDAQYELDVKAAGGAAAGNVAMQSSALDGAAAAAATSSGGTAVPRTGDKRLDRIVVVSAGNKEYDGDIVVDLNANARRALAAQKPSSNDSDIRSFCVQRWQRGAEDGGQTARAPCLRLAG
jgi:hypothetical protein